MKRIILAIDIGNTRIKLGLFDLPATQTGIATPSQTLAIPLQDWNELELQDWLADVPASTEAWIASVNRGGVDRLTAWLATSHPAIKLRQLSHLDLPIEVDLANPEHVGIDRLSGAVAANRLRAPARSAITIHVGTAITVNQITAEGVFRGGAIAPGISISARALDEFTDLLPYIPLEELDGPIPALGTNTLAAIHSGLFWGAIGVIRELAARLSEPFDVKPDVFMTGGTAAAVARLVDPSAQYIDHLVLSGIALAIPT
ncbi:MAG: type III pantothenate kinase [Pirellulales bacterium]|nr:type III pantothenate kinase [Pirellulales bacterium]